MSARSQVRDQHVSDAKHDRKQRVLTKPVASRTRSIAQAIVIKEGDIFFLCDPNGLVPNQPGHGLGLYYHDCRFLNGYDLEVAGASPQALGANSSQGFMAAFELTNHELKDANGKQVGKETIGLRWERLLSGQQRELYDTLIFTNYGPHPVTLPLRMRFHAEFEDIFTVRGMLDEHPGKLHTPEWRDDHLAFAYDGIDGVHRRVHIRFSPTPHRHDDASAEFTVRLGAAQSEKIEVWIAIAESKSEAKSEPHIDDHIGLGHVEAGLKSAAQHSLEQNTQTRSDSRGLDKVLNRSLHDLHMLRTHYGKEEFFAAGIPWFTTLFGRDSLITALFMLGYDQEVARQTLRVLAHFQGKKTDPWTEEQPGKILHELRRGELARSGQVPYTPYYGTVDATILFLIAVGYYVRWSGKLDLFHELRDHIEAALTWIDKYGNVMGNGYVAYVNHADHGLINEGWKDSTDAIPNADGSLATPPIAPVEVQGYVYLARRLIADLFDHSGETERAQRLRAEAEHLRDRFNGDFWLPDKGFFALALQKGNKPAAVVSSNPGQALWTGIVDATKAKSVLRHLLADDMFSGWGIRTLSTHEKRYNPIGYHLGTVWPHDNALIVAGLRRYGFDEAALKVADGIFDAATWFQNGRLPELFSGFPRSEYEQPVRYPVANHPQAWAAAAVPFLIVTLAGLEPRALEKRLRVVRPQLPSSTTMLELRELRVADARVDLRLTRNKSGHVEAEVLRVDGDLHVEIEHSDAHRH